ncbi:LIC_12616 family protein [Bacillus thuringiensis]|uniref:phage neck terminator protein n=1 Tax=Bacillus thuringiensis TaxID=1428 RepID=UPI0039874A52
MNVKELRAVLIPAINKHCAAPIIMADQMGERPKVPHATYKLTTPYGKAVGQAEETGVVINGEYKLQRLSDYKTTISFTAYAMDDDDSVALAQEIYDWFSFAGVDVLQSIGVAVADQTDIINRDAFVIEDYERRNGFDVILRVPHQQLKDIEWIDVAVITEGGISNG